MSAATVSPEAGGATGAACRATAGRSRAALAQPEGGHASHRYLTYPHANGFCDGGSGVVFGQTEERRFSFWRRSLLTGREERLGSLPRVPEDAEVRWFDVAAEANALFVIQDNAVWRLDLAAKPEARRFEPVYREPVSSHAVLGVLPALSADGRRLVCERLDGNRHQICEITLPRDGQAAAGRARLLAEFPWHANHFHFCPRDEAWLGFCHEGPTEQVPDRVWGWHAELAPGGRCLFDNGAAGLCVGHERWAFHDTTVFVVAYGASPGSPRGIYEIFPEARGGRTSRLVSEGDRDWHVDVSRDGRWAVVDTTGPHDAPGRSWEDAGDVSDVLLIDVATGRREFLARSRYHPRHPRHLHPVFSPDGAVIFYNESGVNGAGHCIRAVANPWWSPAV